MYTLGLNHRTLLRPSTVFRVYYYGAVVKGGVCLDSAGLIEEYQLIGLTCVIVPRICILVFSSFTNLYCSVRWVLMHCHAKY